MEAIIGLSKGYALLLSFLSLDFLSSFFFYFLSLHFSWVIEIAFGLDLRVTVLVIKGFALGMVCCTLRVILQDKRNSLYTEVV